MTTTEPPSFVTSIYNSEAFSGKDNFITLEFANKTYLKLGGGFIFGSLSIGQTLSITGDTFLNGHLVFNGVTLNESYYLGITAGMALASKALVLDSSRNITNINNIVSTSICLGNQTSNITGRFLSAYNSSHATTTLSSISFGQSNSDRNAVDFNFLYNGVSDNTNAFSIGFPTVGRRLTILASGNVGISNNSPSFKLDVSGTINTSGLLRTTSAGIGWAHTDGTIGLISYVDQATNPGGALIGTTTNHGLAFQTNGTEKVNISNTGNVGIRNSTNTYKLDVSGSLNCTSFYISGSQVTATAAELNYLDITTTGTAQASKALVLDASRTITNINSLTATSLKIGSTLGDSALNALSNSGDISFRFGKSLSANNCITLTWNSTSQYLSFNIYGKSNQLVITASGDVGIGTATPSCQLDLGGVGTGINTGSLKFNGITLNHNYYIGITEGGAIASKALVVNSTKDISGINNFGCSVFTASTSIAGLAIITDSVTLGGTLLTSSTTELNKLTGLTSSTTELNKLTGLTSSTAELNYLDITTIGTAEASKALTVDVGRNITNINWLTLDKIDVRLLYATTLYINSPTLNFGDIAVKGSMSSSYFGSSSAFFCAENSNVSTIAFEMNVSNSPASTSTNPIQMGTTSNNDLVFFTNSVERLRIKKSNIIQFPNGTSLGNVAYASMVNLHTSGVVLVGTTTATNTANWLEVNGAAYVATKIGIGIANTLYPLEINGSYSTSVVGYGYITSGGSTGFISGNSGSVPFSAKFSNRIIVGGEIDIISDRRKKKNVGL